MGAVALATALAGPTPAPAQTSGGFGQLTGAAGCISQVAPGDTLPKGCAAAKGLYGANAVAVSPDGKNVYVASSVSSQPPSPDNAVGFGAIVTFRRDPSSGTLTQTDCISTDGTDGNDAATSMCTLGVGLQGADAVAVSPDGMTVYVAASVSGGIVALVRDPSSGKLSESACLDEQPPTGSPCPPARVFRGSNSVAVSPDSKQVYVGSAPHGTLSSLLGAAATCGAAPAPSASGSGGPAGPCPTGLGPGGAAAGATAVSTPSNSAVFGPLPNPCIAVASLDGGCANGAAMQGIDALAASPDGKYVYAGARTSQAIDWFTRDPSTGAVAQAGCLKRAAPAGLCSDAKLLGRVLSLAVAPDGTNVYAAQGDRLVVLSRNAATGALTEGACYDQLVAPASPSPGTDNAGQTARARPQRHARTAQGTSPCQAVPGLDAVNAVALSADGSSVYTAGDDALAAFHRDPATGKLTETVCAVSADSRCGPLNGGGGLDSLAATADAKNVYASARSTPAVLAFGAGALVASGSSGVAHNGAASVAVYCTPRARTGCSGRVQFARYWRSRAVWLMQNGRRRVHVFDHRTNLSTTARLALRPGHIRWVRVRVSARVRGRALRGGHPRVVAVFMPTRGHGGGASRVVTLGR